MTFNPSAAGGIAKYANLASIAAIGATSEGDYAIALDTGITYQYKGAKWVSAFNTFVDPTAGSGWALVERKTFSGTIPAGSFDISGCDRFRVEINQSVASAGNILLQFGSDTGSVYTRQLLNANGTTIAGASATFAGFIGFLAGTQFKTLEFSKSSKLGVCLSSPVSSAVLYAQQESWNYTGSDAMDALTISAGTNTATGTLSVYRWVEQVKPVELASWELVKEYNLSNVILNDTIPWDGERDEMCHIVTSGGITGTAYPIMCSANGDTAAANYPGQYLEGSGSAPITAALTTLPGFYVGYCGPTSSKGRMCISDVYLKTGYGPRKSFTCTGSGILIQNIATSWLNTASPVTSLLFHSIGVAVSGNIKVYRLAKTQLVTTNPNLMTAWQKYVDANTVSVQPGEIEINGAICTVSKATGVTLSGNLESGQAESANTYFYLYAKRTTGRNCSFFFSTTAPLMDRYGNIVASFESCDSAHAWFHPTLGTMCRYIGQVYNDASSNILAFDKCMPGYWESAWRAIPGTGAQVLPHGYGKIAARTYDLLCSTSAAGTNPTASPPCFYNAAFFGTNFSGGGPPTNIAVNPTLGAGGIFYTTAWQTAGYYKIIIKDI